ncbi:MAG: RNA 2',3'-cyclic phosphodiesterase [Stellaceae bacterium]|jgi:2'-5' RNA ligase
MLRLFVGIGLPPEQKLALSLIASGLPEAKWVDPGNYHLTLRFIGEVGESVASDADAALAGIRARRFSLALAGVGHFGTRMLWAGIEKNPELMQLQAKIETALIRAGLEPEGRRYAPHVSLARLIGAPGPKLTGYLSRHALFRAAPFAVDRFALVASYLTKAGPIYEDQAEYELKG